MGASLEIGGASSPVVLGAEAVSRWQEWICPPGYGSGNYNAAWLAMGHGRHTLYAVNAGNASAVWRTLGSVNAFTRPLAGLGLVIELLPAIAAGGAREVYYIFTPVVGAAYPLDFIATYQGATESAPAVPAPLACSISAWVRKRNAGDQPGARQFFGFANTQDVNWSRRIARVGFMGNGVGGFRFGSVNCPTAPAGGVENAQTDIDANSVSPAGMAAPGAAWMHIRIKMISASETQTGRFICYLNGRIAATFANVANFPRSSRSSIDVAEIDYWSIGPVLAAWGNPDAVTQDPGFYIRDLRVRLEEDQTA